MDSAKRLLSGFWGTTTVIQRVGWVAMMIAVALVSGLMKGVASGFTPVASTNPLLSLPNAPTGVVLAWCFMGIIIGPILETFAMQGFLQTKIEQRWGDLTAFALTSVIFFALHWTLDFQVFACSVFLCYMRMQTRSLGTVLISHASWNAIASVIAIAAMRN